MPTYVVLYKLTDQGIKNIKDAPKRIEDGIKGVEKMGGKVLCFYAAMGEYDYVSIGEFPNDDVGMTYLLALNSLGNVRTTTFRVFTPEELAKFVKKLP